MVSHDRSHDLLGRGRRNGDVDVADGLRHSSKAAAELCVVDDVESEQVFDESLCQRKGISDRCSAILAGKPQPIDGFGDFGFAGRSEAWQGAELLCLDRSLQLLDILDAQLASHELECLGPEARDPAELDEFGWIGGPQLVELLHRAGIDELADLAGRCLSDAIDLGELGGGQRRDVAPIGFQAELSFLIGPNFERLWAPLIEG